MLTIDMEAKLDKWKQKLLDLGKRNVNLNFKFNKTSTLKILQPDMDYLWKQIVEQENSLKFQLYKRKNWEEPEEGNDSETEEEDGAEGKPKNRDLVVSSQPLAIQDKILRNLKKKAKTFNEEQGINVLYLCFGFLHYEEGNTFYDAPLILVPVKLDNESVLDPFKLSLYDDEIVTNPTLIYKLQNDYGITLPEYDLEQSLDEYFEEVEALVEDNNWSVQRVVGLGILSFMKISMYKDLLRHKDGIIRNDLIKTIGGDANAALPLPPDLGDLDNNEQLLPQNNFQVVDADSSQQEAIICAKTGVSFVLQGPPGTGKSQTITNIIAECLAAGKKVLFVSEKMAALEVVHKRLKEANLDEFCLIMHSHKANKKQIMDQFADVLKLTEKKLNLSDDAYEKLNRLEEDKKALNEYVRQIHEVIEPLGKTIFDINGILTKLQEAPDLIFGLTDIRHVDKEQLYKFCSLINRYAKCLNDMPDGIQNNPWHGCKITHLTHEIRQNMVYHLDKLIEKLKQIQKYSADVLKEINYCFNDSYRGTQNAEKVLRLATMAKAVPSNWILSDDIAPFEQEITACKETKAKFLEIRDRIVDLQQQIKDKDAKLDFSDYAVLSNSDFIRALYIYLAKIVKEDVIYNKLQTESCSIEELTQKAINLHDNITNYKKIKESISAEYEKEIFAIDYNGIYQRFKTDYSWGALNFLKSSYRSDQKLFKGLRKQIGSSFNNEAIIKTLSDLRAMEENLDAVKAQKDVFVKYFGDFYQQENTDIEFIEKKLLIFKLLKTCEQELANLQVIVTANEKQENILKTHYENLYAGMETDWDGVRSALDWAQSFKSVLTNANENKSFVVNVCLAQNNAVLYGGALAKLQAYNADVMAEFSWIQDIFDSGEAFADMSAAALESRLQDCSDNISKLETWIDYRNARTECENQGLAEFVQSVEQDNIASIQLLDAFKKRFYRLWLDSVLPEYNAVVNFRGDLHSWKVDEFKKLDKQQFAIAKARIRAQLINSLPAFNAMTTGKDEIAILRRELNKRRRIMPIRKLFSAIPQLVMMLKPCMMMSPLTVSLFLESEDFKFDTVIFDEASQVCTENAIGAIFRGKQVIIAGDSKQLPPTNFFQAVTDSDYDEYDEDDESQNDVFESLLDEAALLPSKTLLWHYRSRHEHLIAYSNAKIYRHSLITFPSNVEDGLDVGVQYEYVPSGFYDRGGRKGNINEAARVAEMVFEHFKKCREGAFNRSLGVITFGEVQALAVENALRQKREACPEFEEYFNEDLEEAFFIKSLENVQGDERDTIIFSIGYAKDKNGVMRMAFGPLSQSGGERRLNVAITRAKFNVKLVGSILPTDIDTDRISSEGPKLLRGYIDFAMRGMKALDTEVTDDETLKFDSPFEESVYNFLISKGYNLRTQVGCSSYRIDLGVRHPQIAGAYVLGIECDGASYHSAKTARERDRLRQDVLENMGWKIYRIWSTDWIKSPISEGNKLVEAIEKAIADYGIPNEKTTSGNTFQLTQESLIEEEERDVKEEYTANFAEYPDIENSNAFYFIEGNLTINKLQKKLYKLIDYAYPMHKDMLYQLCCFDFGREKVTSTVRKEIDYALNAMNDQLCRKGDFYFPLGKADNVPLRVAGTRKIEYICQEELCMGIMEIAKQSVGISLDGLLQSTSTAFGFKRRGANITRALRAAYDVLEQENKLQEKDGKIVVFKANNDLDKMDINNK